VSIVINAMHLIEVAKVQLCDRGEAPIEGYFNTSMMKMRLGMQQKRFEKCGLRNCRIMR